MRREQRPSTRQGSRALTLPPSADRRRVVLADRRVPLAVLDEAVEYARAHALAAGTRRTYEWAWREFEGWCDGHGLCALPATPQTVSQWLLAIVATKRDRPLARSTLELVVAAVTSKHRLHRVPFNRDDPLIGQTLQGLGRELAARRSPRKAMALLPDDLLAMLDGLNPTRAADVRDSALLALGWGGALRRSELVGLDWKALGDGTGCTGFVAIGSEGVRITLATSKGSQADAVDIAIPHADMPQAVEALSRWAELAKLQPGQPVFRWITRHQHIKGGRLTAGSVAYIIKQRVRAYAKANGKSKAAANELAAGFSGHSLRRGYGTAAARKDVPGFRIKRHMRHKRMDTTEGYIDEGEAWSRGGLKGVF